MTTKLWVDDIRNPPEGDTTYTIARTYHQAIKLLEGFDYDEIYLDHDLACFVEGREYTGYDIVVWLVQRRHDGHHTPYIYHMLTANPVGRVRMVDTIERYLSRRITL